MPGGMKSWPRVYRAHRLEAALGTPAKIYYKYEGVSPAASHKVNTFAQAYCNTETGIKRIATETGAGQWGSSTAAVRRRHAPATLPAVFLSVAFRIGLLPAPGVRAHARQVVHRAPAEIACGARGVGPALRDVAAATVDNLIGHLPAAGRLERAHHVEHADPVSGAEVPRLDAAQLRQLVQRRHMPARQVDHVDVVTHPGTVGRRVVAA